MGLNISLPIYLINMQDILLEFIEGSLHAILYARGLYPSSLFEPRVMYGMTVFQCRHPDVNIYIKRILSLSKPFIDKNILNSFLFTVKDSSGGVMDIVSLCCSQMNKSTHLKAVCHGMQEKMIHKTLLSVESLDKLEEEFRSTILRLSLLDLQLRRLDDCPGMIDGILMWNIICCCPTILLMFCRLSMGYNARS